MLVLMTAVTGCVGVALSASQIGVDSWGSKVCSENLVYEIRRQLEHQHQSGG